MNKPQFEALLGVSETLWGREKCWDRWVKPGVDPDLERLYLSANKRPLIRRYLYELYRSRGHKLGGPLKKNHPLNHACDNPRCVNPHHQAPAVSAKQMMESGEWAGHPPNDPRGAHNRAKTHCRYGHAYTDENTSYSKDGRRTCLTCQRERAWLPLDIRHIVYPNERVLNPAPKRVPVPPEADDALWNGYEPEPCDDPGDWTALQPDPEEDSGGLEDAA